MRSRLSTAVFLRCHCWFCIACFIQFQMTSINPPPSGRQHNPPLYMWVTSCGVIHVETDLHAVTQYALAQVPRQKPYNYHVLLGGQGIPNYRPPHSPKQTIKYGCQDWYHLRWLQRSGGGEIFPVLGEGADFARRNPCLGICPMALQSVLNGTTKFRPDPSRLSPCPMKSEGPCLHYIPAKIYHWCRLPAAPADALLNPEKYGLCWASSAARDRVLSPNSTCTRMFARAPTHSLQSHTLTDSLHPQSILADTGGAVLRAPVKPAPHRQHFLAGLTPLPFPHAHPPAHA